jgi:hypothetical protein
MGWLAPVYRLALDTRVSLWYNISAFVALVIPFDSFNRAARLNNLAAFLF